MASAAPHLDLEGPMPARVPLTRFGCDQRSGILLGLEVQVVEVERRVVAPDAERCRGLGPDRRCGQCVDRRTGSPARQVPERELQRQPGLAGSLSRDEGIGQPGTDQIRRLLTSNPAGTPPGGAVVGSDPGDGRPNDYAVLAQPRVTAGAARPPAPPAAPIRYARYADRSCLPVLRRAGDDGVEDENAGPEDRWRDDEAGRGKVVVVDQLVG